ncbi:LIM and calponin homology domains-containing protein 1-like isoform X4 [Simochromis diagramma]|uniref:LIM and calponin homology domains-containing protein 1-like isoform X4 n=1 Tax=Simochromis diagramma TaxID=43689 RepID=UPI001A7EC20A|nr:LIM and calponin homology domains-containing protein 1-like isoform X4 [Simochromis diagramma]
MASPAASGDSPNAPREQEQHHPEPACREAQKWIEAVTGKSFGDKDFRSALENGILLCELLSAIKPGLVKKINRLPTPIAGLDNLSVFLRGCEELGLKGAQLFDPGDLQDTSIRANLKDSDCNRKLKNVLNTVYWLGKAASGCASYSGPTLNLKEFEGLLAQMKLESEEGGDSSQKRSVRDSGYDCWDSERSESLSPPRHTRDNSLDSLDSFGSRSQHSPSPDVVNRGNGDGRGSDSEADAPNRKPDVRKDDMLARRTSSKEARSSVPFNQFLPNRTNATSYVPTPRRKPHTEEREQRSQPQATADQCKKFTLLHKTSKTVTWAPENNGEKREEEVVTQEVLEQRRMQKLEKAGIKVLPAVVRYSSPPETEEKEPRSPSPNIILRRDNDFLSSQKSAWDSPSDGEEEAAVRKVPDVRKDDLASRRAHRGTVAPKVHQFIPPPLCTDKDRERWEGIRRASQQMLQEKEISEKEAVADIITRKDNPFLNSPSCHEEEEDEEDEGHEGKVKVMPNKQKDDLARRRAQSRPLPHRDGPVSFVSSSMSQADMQKWERLRMSEPSDTSPGPVCQACLVKNYGGPFSGSAKAGRGQGKVVTFGGVTEIEQPIDTVMSSEGEETELLRRLLSKATVAMPTIGLGSQLSERERSQVVGADPNQTTSPSDDLPPWTTKAAPTPAEIDARLAQYEGRSEEEEEEEEEEGRVPDLQKDDMMARRTGVFHKQSTSTVTYNRFLPLPASKRCTQGAVTTDAAPQNKKKVQADRSKKLDVRVEHQQPMEAPQQQVETTVIRSASQGEWEYGDNEDECGENVPAPDPEKDDMMARRTGSFQKASTAKRNQFLPVPGSVKYNISPVSAMKQLHSRPKLTEKKEGESSIVAVAAEPQALPSKAPTSPTFAVLRERREEKEEKEEKQESEGAMVPNTSATVTAEPLFSPSLVPAPSPGPAQVCSVKSGLEKQKVEERVEEKAEVEERKKDVNEKPRKKPFWLEDDELPPMMMSRRVAFMSEDTESVSMGDMLNEEEVGHLPSLSQSRHEHMHEQYNNFLEDEDHWQDDLARWKNRRRSASQDLIRKEEERKRIEKRMKGEGRDGNKRKSIKTYKEIVEEKERREADLCEAYRSAATPEEAALVLQRYALRFTISDAVLDSLKLPRSTSTPKNELNELDKEQKPESPVNNAEMSEALRQPESPVNNAEMSEALRQPESHVVTNQEHMKPEEIETDTSDQQEKLATSPLTPNSPTSPLSTVTDSQSVSPQSLEFNEPQTQLMESLTAQQAAITGDPQPQTKHTSPQNAQGQPHPTQSANALPSPPSVSSRPIPLLAAKPYCQPGAVLPGHKPIKDGLVRVNGEETEELTVSTPPTSPQHSLQETKDVLSKEAEKDAPPVEAVKSAETAEQQPTETEKSTPSSGSAISSLIEGRNCIITTTIVTELMQKVVEPLHTDTQNDGEVETTGLFEKPEDEKNTQPSSTPSSMEEYSPTVSEGLEESSVTEQYQREQEKLMKEWEKAQLEVEEEERKHNEEERRILEETVTPLNPTGLLNQVSGQTATTSPGTENDNTKGKNVPLQHNGQKISTGNEDQHASKLHFFQDSGADVEPSKKQELWKTASLDRNTQLNQGQVVKRSGSHDGVTSEQQSSSPKPQPPSPSRCVSGKRLCTGCSQPLGKGAAMIIDTLGLFFHMHCFKCGLCGVQLGDATAGTDVRIRKGMLSCHECYIASRGRGQPTTL